MVIVSAAYRPHVNAPHFFSALGEQWISGIQRQETIKCLQKWGFTSEQIVQYMTGGSEKTSSVVSLRMSAGESSTSSMGTRQQFAGNILDGSSLGDIPSVGTSIAGHSANSTSTSTTMNRSISIFGTTMAGKHKGTKGKKIYIYV